MLRWLVGSPPLFEIGFSSTSVYLWRGVQSLWGSGITCKLWAVEQPSELLSKTPLPLHLTFCAWSLAPNRGSKNGVMSFFTCV